jgi:hypothetical protein
MEKLFFKTQLYNISLKSFRLDEKKGEKYEIRFNFDKFKKLVKNVLSNDSSNQDNQVDKFIFDYWTLYPRDLNLKWMTIKCYKKNLLGLKKTLVATSEVDLFMLATGPTHYQLTLTNVDDREENKEKKEKKQEEKLQLSFICKFIQFCPDFSCKIEMIATDERDEKEEEKPHIILTKSMKKSTNEETKEKIFLVDNLVKLSLSVIDLENCILVISDSIKIPLMKDYDPKNLDQFVCDGLTNNTVCDGLTNNTVCDGPTMNIDKNTSVVKGKISRKVSRKVSKGPLYRQMESPSLATENGVVSGKIVPNYLLPNKWYPISNGSNTGNNDISVVSYYRHANDYDDDDNFIIPWKTMELLIHQHFNKLFSDVNDNVKVGTEKDKEREILQLKKKLNFAIIKAKIKYKIDIYEND